MKNKKIAIFALMVSWLAFVPSFGIVLNRTIKFSDGEQCIVFLTGVALVFVVVFSLSIYDPDNEGGDK